MTITLQVLSLVEKAELVQVHFTLHLRDQRSVRMQDGCLHGFLHGIQWIMFHGHLNYSQKSPLGGIDLKQNQETMAFQTLTTLDVFYFIMRRRLV